jgi:hypothetical protein
MTDCFLAKAYHVRVMFSISYERSDLSFEVKTRLVEICIEAVCNAASIAIRIST